MLGFSNSSGTNLIGNATDTGLRTLGCAASDLCNRAARLAPLANNGGATQTHALLPNSPAINAGNNRVLIANGCSDGNQAILLDQRGKVRVGAVDIGAFEFTARTRFDFDGDGRADQGVFRPSDSIWYLLRSQAGFSATRFGLGSDKIVPADFDGDGKADYAVYRDGVWYMLRSSQGFAATQFGIASDRPTVADFDGDGKADQAVYRSGAWYVLGSSQGFYGAQFGIATDMPVAADYDGDGKADFAVYRDGVWYMLRTQQGFGAVQFGTLADRPVPVAFVPPL